MDAKRGLTMRNFTGKEYLQIEIAGHHGLGGESFKERIDWVNHFEMCLEDLLVNAKDFYQYASAVKAYRQAQAGEPSGYLIGFDAVASGIQLLSVLTGCKVGAANSCVTGQVRNDPYMIATDIMNDVLCAHKKYDRETVKPALMCHYYNSIEEPKLAFGEDTPELYAFYQAAKEVAPGAEIIMPIINNLQDPEVLAYRWDYPDGFVVNYKVKDTIDTKIEIDTLTEHPTFVYRHKVNTPMEKIRFLPSGIVHGTDGYLVRELSARCNYDEGMLRTAYLNLVQRLKKDIYVPEMAYLYPEQMWHKHRCLSLVGVEYVTDWSCNQMSTEYCLALLKLIRETLSKPSFEVVTVHDQFECLPNYMNHVRQTYIDLLAEIADSRMLDAILSDIACKPTTFEKLSTDLSSLIRDAEYPLC